MNRLSRLRPDELDDEQATLYAEITAGPRAGGPFALTDAEGRLEGPFNAMLFSPDLGRSLQDLGAAVRYRTELTPRVREIAVLVVAQVRDSAFERQAHERAGAAAGLTEDELAALREGRDPRLGDAVEHAAWWFTRALARYNGTVDDVAYEAARSALGERALFELSTLVGYYATLALQLRLFKV
ncbi:carboxymuconolactone decarboxylase family protein [Streptomyces sp. NPDC090106]|uniref:carboxymuconolactone decarboxylase family protein n=1 Tax=Streptomyces sp. NPDC090106 TaxID=3365946 RepID=UPI00380D81D8